MRVILIQNIPKIGNKGDLKDVSDGYARNFLLPKNLAKIATPEGIKEILKNKEEERIIQKKNYETLKKLSDKISQKKIILKAKEKDGKLFGSIGKKEVRNALKLENIDVEEQMILQENPIKKTGDYKIKIRLANEIETDIIVVVEGDK